jgi:hypothetical protein
MRATSLAASVGARTLGAIALALLVPVGTARAAA